MITHIYIWEKPWTEGALRSAKGLSKNYFTSSDLQPDVWFCKIVSDILSGSIHGVYIYIYICTFWHSIAILACFSDILFGILCSILSHNLSGIYSDILSDIGILRSGARRRRRPSPGRWEISGYTVKLPCLRLNPRCLNTLITFNYLAQWNHDPNLCGLESHSHRYAH